MTPEARSNLPASSFAGKDRSFPVNDNIHARLALSGASHSYNVGNITATEKERIDKQANRMLGVGNGGYRSSER
jgi:hypothetical protein